MALAFSPDGCYLATAGGSDFLEGGKELQDPNVIAVDGRLRLWEVGSGQEVRAFPADAQATVLAFSPDRRSLATGTKDGGVWLWDLTPPTKDAKPADLSAEEFDRLWALLAGDDGVAAYKAQLTLRAAERKAVRFLALQLRPPPADDPKLGRLLLDLEADSFAVRETARNELQRLGADAEPALRLALRQAPSSALRTRMLPLLTGPSIVQQADALARVRAVSVLEAVGTEEARDLLAKLAKGPPLVEQTTAARAALDRLERRGR
jgi:hypothetical protein